MYSSWYNYLYYYWLYHRQIDIDLESGIYNTDLMDICPMNVDIPTTNAREILQQTKQELYYISEKLNIIGNIIGNL